MEPDSITKIRVYLDNCTYNRPYDDQSQIRISLETQAKLYIQRLIIDKKLDLVCSYMSVYENNENPNSGHRDSVQQFFYYASEFIDIDKADIIEKCAEILKKDTIKANDAIHLACAIEGKCDYFLTTDDGIIKKIHKQNIHICNPINFVSEVYYNA